MRSEFTLRPAPYLFRHGAANISFRLMSARTATLEKSGRHAICFRKIGVHLSPRLCAADVNVTAWRVPARIIQAPRKQDHSPFTCIVDQEQRRPTVRTEAAKHGMAAISSALEPLRFPFFELEICLFHQDSRKICTSSCLLAITAMAIPHVAGDTFGPVSNCSASASTGELFWQHKYSSQVYLRKVNLFRNTLKVLHGFTGKTVLGSTAVKGRFVRKADLGTNRSECLHSAICVDAYQSYSL